MGKQIERKRGRKKNATTEAKRSKKKHTQKCHETTATRNERKGRRWRRPRRIWNVMERMIVDRVECLSCDLQFAL